ncbi:MAG: hypothetical protein GXO02_04030 [Epsilonproteobacteria bacterium]|nr:hypothetical protein [Campylobacterota bacterium]
MAKKKSNLGIIYIVISIITLLTLLKVYFANEIYYISRDINKLLQKKEALKEEQNLLQIEIEKLKFKNSIEDTLFIIQEDTPIKSDNL